MKPSESLPGAVYLVCAVGGLSVSNLYFSQPLLPSLSASINASPAAVTYLPAVTQIGFVIDPKRNMAFSSRALHRRSTWRLSSQSFAL